jgi:hypothetical protein
MTKALKPLFSDLTHGIDRLERRAKAAATLTEQVRAALPELLRPHVVGANARSAAPRVQGRAPDDARAGPAAADTAMGTELVVIVDSAAWAARVRYASRRLRETLAASRAGRFAKLRVRVRAPLAKAAAE